MIFLLDALLLSLNNIPYVDLTFLRHYPDLKTLSLDKNSVRSLSKSTKNYQPFFSLVHMDLSHNHLHIIHPYVFTGTIFTYD